MLSLTLTGEAMKQGSFSFLFFMQRQRQDGDDCVSYHGLKRSDYGFVFNPIDLLPYDVYSKRCLDLKGGVGLV